MNHTAVELFPDWYNKGINKEASNDELTLRRKAINLMIDNNDISKWFIILKVYFGLCKAESTEYDLVVELVKNGDENFLIKNENLVRILAGCAIAQKIEKGSSSISHGLALAIICSSILPVSGPIADLLSRSISFWIRECESKREMDLNFKIGAPITSIVKVEIPDLTQDPTTWKANSDSISKIITVLKRDLNKANEEIVTQQKALTAAKQNFVALAEETNILWWLFGAYSSILEKKFDKLTPEVLCILVAFELSKLTKSLPGIGGVESIIHKALSNLSFESGSTYSVESILNAVNEYEGKIKEFLPQDTLEIQTFTPLLSALRNRIDFAGNEWKNVYQRISNFDLSTKVTYENFSSQLYKELMLFNVYNHAKV